MHRDVKPENLLFHPVSLTVVLADYGAAAPHAGFDNQPAGGGLKNLYDRAGTPRLYCPEIVVLSADVEENMRNKRGYRGDLVDIFNLGYTLYHLVFGTQCYPFESASPNDPFFKCMMTDDIELFWQ